MQTSKNFSKIITNGNLSIEVEQIYVKILLILVIILKLLDMLTSYVGMSIGLIETNPLPYFFLAGIIFITMIAFILIKFDFFYKNATKNQLHISQFALLIVIAFQISFVLNNIYLILSTIK